MRRSCLLELLLGCLASAASGQTAHSPAQLEQRIPEVSFADAPLDLVLAWVAETAGTNVVVRWQSLEDRGVERDQAITLKLRNVRLSQALMMILSEAGGSDTRLGYRVDDGVLTITTADDVNSEMIVVVYDVRDLLITVRNFPGPRIDTQRASQQGQGGGVLTDANTEEPQPAAETVANQGQLQNLIQVIRATIEPDTWDGHGGTGTIESYGGQLIVRNTILVHQKLGGPVQSTFVAVVR